MQHVILRMPVKPKPHAAPLVFLESDTAAMAAPEPAARALTVENADLSPAEVRDVQREAGVRGVAPIVPMKLIAPVAMAGLPADPLTAGITWGVKAVGADTSPFVGDGIVVAVLDTGIDKGHAAFAGVELVRKNFTSSSDDDEHGHGTHCAGTIFGRAVGGTRIGVAPGVKKALIGKVLGAGGGGSDVIVRAIQWAFEEGANVISMSLGIDFPGFVAALQAKGMPAEMATSMALEGYRTNILLFEQLAGLVKAQGALVQACVIAAAAGNESRRDQNPDFEIGVSPPAVAAGIVSVAALAEGAGGLTVAPFSNTGARVAGPGVNIVSAKAGNPNGTVAMSGTSMATPHVAGVAALWAEKLKKTNQLTPQMLSDKLVGSATQDTLKPGFDPADTGGGIVQAPKQ